MTTFRIASLAPGTKLRSGHAGWIELTVLEVNCDDTPHWMRVGWTDAHGRQHEWRVAEDVTTYWRTLQRIEDEATAFSRAP